MTPEKRLERILTLVNLPGSRSVWEDRKNGFPLSSYEAVLREINEAQKEAFQSGCNTHLAICAERFKGGRESMKEEAARIGEEAVKILLMQDQQRFDGDDGPTIKRTVEGLATAIRAIPVDVKID